MTAEGPADDRRQLMPTGRLEAFSDGVLAIIITVMVLALPIPDEPTLADLRRTSGTGLLSYVLSFTYVGIYWNNHHHVFQLTSRISGRVLWANLHLLFWLSLLPFTTAWMDSTGFARVPVVTYGVDLLAAAVAYVVLQTVIIADEGPGSALKEAVGPDLRGKVSMVLYLAGIGAALLITPDGLWARLAAMACFVAVAVLWIVPDRRIERVVAERGVGG